MAKFVKEFKGDFEKFVQYAEDCVRGGSVSANLENSDDYTVNGTKVAVRVFERYSAIGSNRVSLNLTIVGSGDMIHFCAITSGGSQAMFFKINTFGEESFLHKFEDCVEKYLKHY